MDSEGNIILTDPTADYCRQMAAVLTKATKRAVRVWYRIFRSLGCTAVDSLCMARQTVRDEFGECDFTVNFDGPME